MKIKFRTYQFDTHAHIAVFIGRWSELTASWAWAKSGDLCCRAEEYDGFKAMLHNSAQIWEEPALQRTAIP